MTDSQGLFFSSRRKAEEDGTTTLLFTCVLKAFASETPAPWTRLVRSESRSVGEDAQVDAQELVDDAPQEASFGCATRRSGPCGGGACVEAARLRRGPREEVRRSGTGGALVSAVAGAVRWRARTVGRVWPRAPAVELATTRGAKAGSASWKARSRMSSICGVRALVPTSSTMVSATARSEVMPKRR